MSSVLKLIIFATIFLIIISGFEARSEETKNPIYTRLLQLQPSLDKKLAKDISNEIYRCHKSIGIDKFLLTAIYNQESQINYKAKNCLKGILEKGALEEILDIVQSNMRRPINRDKLKQELKHIPFTVCFDLGIGQINVNTALRHEQCSDLKRLITDYKYNISCSCKVLESFKKAYGSKEDDWWTRYNAGNSEKREIYKQLVLRYYPKKIKENSNKDIKIETNYTDNNTVNTSEEYKLDEEKDEKTLDSQS